MSDAELRGLEARWKGTGATADHAAYLAAQVRAGRLEEERLRFAAALGSPGAIEALGATPGDPFDPEEGLVDWLRSRGDWPGDVAASAMVSVAELLLETSSKDVAERVAPVVAATLVCLARPSEQAAADVDLAVATLWNRERGEGRLERALEYIAGAAGLGSRDLARGASEPKSGWRSMVSSAANMAARVEREDRVRQALSEGAISRLLGRAREASLPGIDEWEPPVRPPIDGTLRQLRSTLRWVSEHLGSYQSLRETDPELAERELHYLNGEVRDAGKEAERLSEILRLWDAASKARSSD